jgi:hypothetical protein
MGAVEQLYYYQTVSAVAFPTGFKYCKGVKPKGFSKLKYVECSEVG